MVIRVTHTGCNDAHQDFTILRLIEIMRCFPTLLIIMTLVAFVDDPTIWHVMLIIGLVRWTGPPPRETAQIETATVRENPSWSLGGQRSAIDEHAFNPPRARVQTGGQAGAGVL